MLGTARVVATLPVTDLDKAKAFYGDTLGLAQVWESPYDVRYRCGSASELSVFKRGPTTEEHTQAHFEVTDIEAEVRDLEGRGVEFIDYAEGPLATTGHIARLGEGRGAWFHDPDGNILGLRQG